MPLLSVLLPKRDDFSSENFWPFSCKQIVTGLGVGDPPAGEVKQKPYLRKILG